MKNIFFKKYSEEKKPSQEFINSFPNITFNPKVQSLLNELHNIHGKIYNNPNFEVISYEFDIWFEDKQTKKRFRETRKMFS